MRDEDAALARLSEARNALEARVFAMRQEFSKKPHGALLDRAAVAPLLDAAEEWLYDDGADGGENATLAQYEARREALEADLRAAAGPWFEAMAAAREKMEREMEEAAKKAAEEAAANGGKDDVDTKLPKAARMKKLNMNKKEGNELFRDGNYAHAEKRYIRALQHARKFADLDPAGRDEVDAATLSVRLNLAQVYVKLKDWANVVKQCDEALPLCRTPSSKLLYRRAMALQSDELKRYKEAEKDLLTAQGTDAGKDDKNVALLLKRVRILIKREKKKAKKMAKKMFG